MSGEAKKAIGSRPEKLVFPIFLKHIVGNDLHGIYRIEAPGKVTVFIIKGDGNVWIEGQEYKSTTHSVVDEYLRGMYIKISEKEFNDCKTLILAKV